MKLNGAGVGIEFDRVEKEINKDAQEDSNVLESKEQKSKVVKDSKRKHKQNQELKGLRGDFKFQSLRNQRFFKT